MKRLPFGLTPVRLTILISTIIVLLVIYMAGSLYFSAQSSATRTVRLYRLVTAPGVQQEPLQSVNGQGHGTIYYEVGNPTFVVVVSDLPPIPSDQQYFAWFQRGDENVSRQRVRFDADGVARISQDGYDPTEIDRVIIARERAHTLRQDGPVLLRWDRR